MALELKDLSLQDARVEIIYYACYRAFSRWGRTIEFIFTANVGEPPKPLVMVASG
jgi:DNA repair protein RecN (Recombination protein N)